MGKFLRPFTEQIEPGNDLDIVPPDQFAFGHSEAAATDTAKSDPHRLDRLAAYIRRNRQLMGGRPSLCRRMDGAHIPIIGPKPAADVTKNPPQAFASKSQSFDAGPTTTIMKVPGFIAGRLPGAVAPSNSAVGR